MLSAECTNSTICNSILTTFQAPNPSYSSYCGVLPAPQSSPPTHFMPLQSMAHFDCLFQFDTMHPSPTVHQISAWIHLACRVPKRPLHVHLLSTTKGANQAPRKSPSRLVPKIGHFRAFCPSHFWRNLFKLHLAFANCSKICPDFGNRPILRNRASHRTRKLRLYGYFIRVPVPYRLGFRFNI